MKFFGDFSAKPECTLTMFLLDQSSGSCACIDVEKH